MPCRTAPMLSQNLLLRVFKVNEPQTDQPCPGCGGLFAPMDGPTHRYMRSSPGCWHGFGQIIAAEFANDTLMGVHTLSVDCLAVQHPGDGSRQAIQSVGMHLARLVITHDQANQNRGLGKTRHAMQVFARHKASLPLLKAPARFTITVADIVPFVGAPSHADKIHQWANATLEDWREHHNTIREWANHALNS